MKKGFTLIEVIIYIALFSILIGGSLITTYQLIQGSNNLNSKKTLQDESNFLLRKLDWALTGISPTIPNPLIISGTGCSQTLTIRKTDPALDPINIRLNTLSNINYIELQSGVNIFHPITTVNASTTCLKFSLISGIPTGVIATTTINGIDFVITKYLRK